MLVIDIQSFLGIAITELIILTGKFFQLAGKFFQLTGKSRFVILELSDSILPKFQLSCKVAVLLHPLSMLLFLQLVKLLLQSVYLIVTLSYNRFGLCLGFLKKCKCPFDRHPQLFVLSVLIC